MCFKTHYAYFSLEPNAQSKHMPLCINVFWKLQRARPHSFTNLPYPFVPGNVDRWLWLMYFVELFAHTFLTTIVVLSLEAPLNTARARASTLSATSKMVCRIDVFFVDTFRQTIPNCSLTSLGHIRIPILWLDFCNSWEHVFVHDMGYWETQGNHIQQLAWQ